MFEDRPSAGAGPDWRGSTLRCLQVGGVCVKKKKTRSEGGKRSSAGAEKKAAQARGGKLLKQNWGKRESVEAVPRGF